MLKQVVARPILGERVIGGQLRLLELEAINGSAVAGQYAMLRDPAQRSYASAYPLLPAEDGRCWVAVRRDQALYRSALGTRLMGWGPCGRAPDVGKGSVALFADREGLGRLLPFALCNRSSCLHLVAAEDLLVDLEACGVQLHHYETRASWLSALANEPARSLLAVAASDVEASVAALSNARRADCDVYIPVPQITGIGGSRADRWRVAGHPAGLSLSQDEPFLNAALLDFTGNRQTLGELL